VAELSYRAIELPVRSGRLFAGRGVFRAAAAATAVVAIATRAVPAPPVDPLYAALEGVPGQVVTQAEIDAVKPPDVIEYSFFGDSSALAIARAFGEWAKRTAEPKFWPQLGQVWLGCGIMGEARRSTGVGRWAGECQDPVWGPIAKERQLDLAVVQSGVWETFDHRLAPNDEIRGLGDARFDAYLKERMERIADGLAEQAVVVWILAAHLVPGGTGQLEAPPPIIFDRARIDRHNQLVREVAAARPLSMAVVDLSAILATMPNGELDLNARPDGVHFTNDAASMLSDKVGPAIYDAYRTVLARRAQEEAGPPV